MKIFFIEKFSEKTGVKLMCEYNKPIELLAMAIKILQGNEQKI